MAHRVIYTRPYDAEVKYLEYDGRQYIDTGITPNETIEAEIKIVPTSVRAGSTGLLAARNNPQTASVSLNINSLSLWVNGTKVALNDNNYDSGWVNDAMTYDTSAVLKISNRKLYVDDVLTKSSGKTNVFSFDVSYGLLRCKHINNIWDTRQGSSGRLFYTKIWKNETLVRDFIPVRVGSVGYMYDRVSGKLFSNKGTGNFILGPDVTNSIPNIRRVFRFGNKRFVMPMPYDRRVEYLESTGTQYIDTGVIIDSETAFAGTSVDFQAVNINNGTCVIAGSVLSEGANRYKNLNLLVYNNKFYIDGAGWRFNNNVNDITLRTIATATGTAKGISRKQFLLFARYVVGLGASTSNSGCRIFSCKIYKNEILICDLIPVRIGNVGYMYDRISGNLFGNSGTGQFILGNDIND